MIKYKWFSPPFTPCSQSMFYTLLCKLVFHTYHNMFKLIIFFLKKVCFTYRYQLCSLYYLYRYSTLLSYYNKLLTLPLTNVVIKHLIELLNYILRINFYFYFYLYTCNSFIYLCIIFSSLNFTYSSPTIFFNF